jgi:hypothetical protein
VVFHSDQDCFGEMTFDPKRHRGRLTLKVRGDVKGDWYTWFVISSVSPNINLGFSSMSGVGKK